MQAQLRIYSPKETLTKTNGKEATRPALTEEHKARQNLAEIEIFKVRWLKQGEEVFD